MMPTIKVNGIKIAYLDTGTPPDQPNAATLVFGHGTLFDSWMFRSQIAALRHRYRCVALDWRAHGATPATRTGYDMDSLTNDAVAIINRLDVAPVHWIGLSTGGFVGQRLAARHGELLRSVTLIGTHAGTESPRAIRRYRLLAVAFVIFGPVRIGPLVAQQMFSQTYLAANEGQFVVTEWLQRLRQCQRRGIVKAVRAVMGRPSIEAELSHITVPTLAIAGANDRATPPHRVQRMTTAIQGARMVRIADCGHCSTLEQSTVVSELLTEFLAEVDDQRNPKSPSPTQEI